VLDKNYKQQTTLTITLKPMAAALALALFAMGAQAQQEESATRPGQLETVVVTANKRVEKLESVPMAISVMSEQEIQRTNVREIEDIVNMMPSLTLNSGTTAANNAIFMRGIGTVSVGIGVESDVAVIIDDIPIATQFQAFKDLADVARIEVLKGPQSTLFGKSAVAGAVNIVTKPLTGPMTYRASTYLTNDNEWRVGASAGGRINDQFALRIAASDTRYPGNFHNLSDGHDVNGSGGKTFMAKFEWSPLDNLSIDLTPHYNYQNNTRRHRHQRLQAEGPGRGPGRRLLQRQPAAARHHRAGRDQRQRPGQQERAPRLPDRPDVQRPRRRPARVVDPAERCHPDVHHLG